MTSELQSLRCTNPVSTICICVRRCSATVVTARLTPGGKWNTTKPIHVGKCDTARLIYTVHTDGYKDSRAVRACSK